MEKTFRPILQHSTKQNPFFSVLTACFNSCRTIRDNLLSVRYQSFDDLEHIVIDGDSEDNTISILYEFDNNEKLQWISETDRGIAHALNKGLQLAKGRYILIINGDDRLVDKNVLLRIYSELKNENLDIFSCPVFKETPSGDLRPYRPRYRFAGGIILRPYFRTRDVLFIEEFSTALASSGRILPLRWIMIFFTGPFRLAPR